MFLGGHFNQNWKEARGGHSYISWIPLVEKIPLTTESPIYFFEYLRSLPDFLIYYKLYFCLQQKVNFALIMECWLNYWRFKRSEMYFSSMTLLFKQTEWIFYQLMSNRMANWIYLSLFLSYPHDKVRFLKVHSIEHIKGTRVTWIQNTYPRLPWKQQRRQWLHCQRGGLPGNIMNHS